MLCILDFTIHFATLYFINCACSRSNSRPERRGNEKKPFDRIEGRKCMMKFPRRENFLSFSAKTFFLQKTWHHLSTWDAPHIWLHHGVHLLADMKAAISDTASFFPRTYHCSCSILSYRHLLLDGLIVT